MVLPNQKKVLYFSLYGTEPYDLTVNSQKNAAQEIAPRLKQLVEK